MTSEDHETRNDERRQVCVRCGRTHARDGRTCAECGSADQSLETDYGSGDTGQGSDETDSGGGETDRQLAVWAASWSVLDPDGPFRPLRWVSFYAMIVSFPLALFFLLVGIFPIYAYNWIVFWWPWTVFLMVDTWALDNVAMYLRNR